MHHRLALVTGATSGIGMELARFLANKGISLILTGSNKEKLEKISEEIALKVPVISIQADLKDEVQRKKLVGVIIEKVPDLVINNAGFGLIGDVLSFTTEQQMNIVEVNVNALVELTIEAGRALIANSKPGVILNVSSVAGFYLQPGMSIYAATKAFVTNFSQSCDIEFERQGVRVLCICPGIVKTNFSERAGGKDVYQFMSMTSESVVKDIWKQIENFKPLEIVDWKYRLMSVLSKLLPQRWLGKRIYKEMRERIFKD